jgi:Fe-S-cluster containining protein
MTLELDLNIIKQKSISREKENYKFRAFLKECDDNKIDKIVHAIYDKVIGEIDCTQCGNCCKHMNPSLTMKEIRVLSKIDNITTKAYIENHTEINSFENTHFLKQKPCKYLNDKICTIYESRPNDCKSFPHIHKSSFSSRTLSMIEYYGICPIVFNVMEQLKGEFRFRSLI